MLEEYGVVTEIKNECVTIEMERQNGCTHCSNSSCTTSVLAQLFSTKKTKLIMDNKIVAKEGQVVVIGISDSVLVKSAIWAYLIPLLLMIIFTLVANAFGASDGWQILIAVAGLLTGLKVSCFYSSLETIKETFRPELLRQADIKNDIE